MSLFLLLALILDVQLIHVVGQISNSLFSCDPWCSGCPGNGDKGSRNIDKADHYDCITDGPLNCINGIECNVYCEEDIDNSRRRLLSVTNEACFSVTINCPSNAMCNIYCDYSCNSMIVNAQSATLLNIENCGTLNGGCDNMQIHCPLHNGNGVGNTCIIGGSTANTVQGLNIYAQESFFDVDLSQIVLTGATNYIHCGETSTERQCIIDINNNDQCEGASGECQNYFLTPSPTTAQPTTSEPTTSQPSTNPTKIPSHTPTTNPSAFPTNNPSFTPTTSPTQPSISPTLFPTHNPTISPTQIPTKTPTTAQPSISPTGMPSSPPTTAQPTTPQPTRQITATNSEFSCDPWCCGGGNADRGPRNIVKDNHFLCVGFGLQCIDGIECNVYCERNIANDRRRIRRRSLLTVTDEACFNTEIFCPSNAICNVYCDYSCNSIIIHAENSLALNVFNCGLWYGGCDDMIIFCPFHDGFGSGNTCNIGDQYDNTNTINGLHIYAQESFFDVDLTQINLAGNSNIMHCGETATEHSCIINPDVDEQCTNGLLDKCTNYQFTQSPTNNPTTNPTTYQPTINPTPPTNQPTQIPTLSTLYPTVIPTQIPTVNPTFTPTTSAPTYSPTTSLPTHTPTTAMPSTFSPTTFTYIHLPTHVQTTINVVVVESTILIDDDAKNNAEKGSGNGGVIAVAVICPIIVCFLCVLVYLIYRRRKMKKAKELFNFGQEPRVQSASSMSNGGFGNRKKETMDLWTNPVHHEVVKSLEGGRNGASNPLTFAASLSNNLVVQDALMEDIVHHMDTPMGDDDYDSSSEDSQDEIEMIQIAHNQTRNDNIYNVNYDEEVVSDNDETDEGADSGMDDDIIGTPMGPDIEIDDNIDDDVIDDIDITPMGPDEDDDDDDYDEHTATDTGTDDYEGENDDENLLNYVDTIQ